MQMIQPFAPVVVDVVLTTYALWAWLARRMCFPFASLIALALSQLPLAGYDLAVLYRDLDSISSIVFDLHIVRTGHLPQCFTRAVHTSAPSSISA